MKVVDLIYTLTRLADAHGNISVRLFDPENGYGDVVVEVGDAGSITQFVSLASGPRFTREVVANELKRVLQICPIDHWSWNPEHVAVYHGQELRLAGVTDLDAWVVGKRAEKLA